MVVSLMRYNHFYVLKSTRHKTASFFVSVTLNALDKSIAVWYNYHVK